MPFNCPKCRRPLYNRRRATCEFCNAPIPQSHQLPQTKRAYLKQVKEAGARAHAQWMKRQQETTRTPDLPTLGGF